jgi:GrpB-like predicted nucleotidyltransferase (UPF0157 family)
MNARKITLAAFVAAMAAYAVPALAQDATVSQPTNNCAAGEKIDGSTAEQAKQKLEAAGYTDVTGLNKGCDNVWHAQAQSSGNPVNVMVAPDGSVNQETN